MVISPRNSFSFRYELSAVEIPDALRVQFVDYRTWENTERLVFDDGFDESNAVVYESLEAKGVTNPDQAWKYGRYHLAQQRLRPERYTFTQDIQHLRYTRGDLLTLQQDVILVGITAGRIKEVVSDTEIVVDEVFADQGITNYGVKIQHSDGSISIVGCTLGSGPTNQTVFLDSPVTKTNKDDLVIFGEAGKESVDVKVTEIEPEGELVAKVSCVPAAPEIEQAWDGDIPPFDPIITETINPDNTKPRIPVIESITSDESVLYVDDDGSLKVRMVVETSLGSFPGWDQRTQLRFRPVGDNSFDTLEPTSANNVSVIDVDEGIEYEVQVRGVKGGKFSVWSSPVTHTVTGKTNP
ncbi:MAG: phage tail protein, partial [Desulfotignum sp.]